LHFRSNIIAKSLSAERGSVFLYVPKIKSDKKGLQFTAIIFFPNFSIHKMSQSKIITVSDSTSLHVTITGIAPPTLILLHFWGGSSWTFSSLTSYLSPRFRCIAIDFPGWGSSTGPQDPDGYTIKQLATDIETLIPKLDVQEFVLVGHSMGGKVAQLIAGRGLVKGLKGMVLIAPAPPTPLELPKEVKEQRLAAYLSPQSAEFVTRNVLSSSKLDDEIVGMLVKDMMKGNEFARAAWPTYGMAEDILGEAKKIDVPVLLVVGELDRVETVERLGREVLGNLKGTKMVVVEGKGHLLPVEASEEVSRLVGEFVVKVVS
jgi:3-oxoadipate enol-lactonase